MAEAEALGAPKRPNPSLGVEFRGYPLFESDLPPFLDNQELTIAIDQEFEPGDRRRWRREAAQLGVQASAASSLDAMRRLCLAVQRAYFEVVLAEADDDTAKATLEDVDRVVSINRARYDQGELSGVELRRLQVELHVHPAPERVPAAGSGEVRDDNAARHDEPDRSPPRHVLRERVLTIPISARSGRELGMCL